MPQFYPPPSKPGQGKRLKRAAAALRATEFALRSGATAGLSSSAFVQTGRSNLAKKVPRQQMQFREGWDGSCELVQIEPNARPPPIDRLFTKPSANRVEVNAVDGSQHGGFGFEIALGRFSYQSGIFQSFTRPSTEPAVTMCLLSGKNVSIASQLSWARKRAISAKSLVDQTIISPAFPR